MNSLNKYKKILEFWFAEKNLAKRFIVDDSFDKEIIKRFGQVWQDACEGLLSNWRETTEGKLAEIIVLDQFSRNINRDTPQAFSQDKIALILSQELISKSDFDASFTDDQKRFAYLPFMHSENLEIQKQSLNLFEKLGHEKYLKYARSHKKTIERFGRFPHRNKILKRDSTIEEKQYLS